MTDNTENEEERTYVLFGKEAVQLYKVSLNTILTSETLEYDVQSFSSIRDFVNESKKWDGFTEISEEDYIILKGIREKNTGNKEVSKKQHKKGCFSVLNIFNKN